MSKKNPQEDKNHLSKLLAAYKLRLKPPQASVEKAVVAAIQESVGVALTPEQVTYQVHTKTITLRVPSTLKTELKKQQSQIQKTLEKTLPASEIPTLFF